METKMMPMLLVKPKSVSRNDITRAQKLGGICIVECEDPEAARFIEPPIEAQLDIQSRAAIDLMRMVLRSQEASFNRATLTKWYCDALLNGTRPQTALPAKQASK